MLDSETLPDHRIMFAVCAFTTLVSLAVVLAPEIRPGYAVLSAPIAIGTFALGVWAYLNR